MFEQENFELEAFQAEVLQKLTTIQQEESQRRPIRIEDGKEVWLIQAERRAPEEEDAENLVQRKDIRQYLCPVLQSVSTDVFEISKAITPVLVGAVLAKTLPIQMNSLQNLEQSPPLLRVGCSDSPF